MNKTISNKKKKTSKINSCDDNEFIDLNISTKVPTKVTESLPSSQKYRAERTITQSEYKIQRSEDVV